MASTKEMQRRAKARKQENKVCVMQQDGSSIITDMDDFQQQVRDSLARSAQELVNQSSPANFDFSLICESAIRTKELTLGGIKFTTCLFLDKRALGPISRHYGKDFVAMFQIWHKGGSMLLPMTQMTIDDAGNNYCDEQVIAKTDTLNRAVAALRLNSNSPVIHHIAMHIAYTETKPNSGKPLYPGIDQLAIYRVWD